MLDKILRMEGYEVAHAHDGESALAELWSNGADTVLLDVRMPGIDGIEVCRRIRRHPSTAHTPVVFLTALNDREFRREGRAAGADDFLTKPFDEAELLARVRNTVRVKRYYDGLEREKVHLTQTVQMRSRELNDASARLERVQRELDVARSETIERLALAAEFRDDETAAHLHRMSHYCHLMARKYGLDEYACEMLRVASPMHDVGKIGIPDHILLKPARLSRDEFEIMKQHAEIGHQILSGSGSELVNLAAVIAYTHHEKWNGSGYPRQLARMDIPVEGRIAAVADVFDALTSARPYKQPWSIDAAVQWMKTGRGVHFDPELLDLFLGSMDEVLEIREQFQDAQLGFEPPQLQ
jgi:putative two-component system response regulator